MTYKLRNAGGYVITRNIPSLLLRNFGGYVAVKDYSTFTMPKTSKNMLFDLVDAVSNSRFAGDRSVVDLGLPAVNDNPAYLVNTKVTLTALPASELSGSVDLYYRRLAFSSVGRPSAAALPILGATTHADVVAAINSNLGLQLESHELEDVGLPDEEGRYDAVVSASCYLFVTGGTKHFGPPPPDPTDLSTSITVDQLTGFTPVT